LKRLTTTPRFVGSNVDRRRANGSLALPHHGCVSASTDFDSPQHMSHVAHSILISAALSQDKIDVVTDVLNVAVADVGKALARKRADLVHSRGVSNLLNSIFERVEQMRKPELVALASLHGLNISSLTLGKGCKIMADHIASGQCGLHKSGFRHLGCASLLASSAEHNANLHVTSMELEDSLTVNFDLAQINILASVMPKLSKRPLRRILEMHKVVFDPLDGKAALRKHLKRYLRRL
jgi:hypothetical protein